MAFWWREIENLVWQEHISVVCGSRQVEFRALSGTAPERARVPGLRPTVPMPKSLVRSDQDNRKAVVSWIRVLQFWSGPPAADPLHSRCSPRCRSGASSDSDWAGGDWVDTRRVGVRRSGATLALSGNRGARRDQRRTLGRSGGLRHRF